MFKCNVCQKIYASKVPYCECGNDEFTYFEDYIPPENKKTYSGGEILSFAVFGMCLIFSVLILLFFNPVKSGKSNVPLTKNSTVQDTVSIPDIDEIWDDGFTQADENSAVEVYKKSLQNLLNSNIQPKEHSAEGRCEIEFTVNSNGKLLNRKMYKGSGDSRFNKIVLNMLKKTPEHRLPPSSLAGQKISGEVIVQDGIIKLYLK